MLWLILTGCGGSDDIGDLGLHRIFVQVGRIDGASGAADAAGDTVDVTIQLVDDGECGRMHDDVDATLDDLPLELLSRGGDEDFDVESLSNVCESSPMWRFHGAADAYYRAESGTSTITLASPDTTFEFELAGLRGAPATRIEESYAIPGDTIHVTIEPPDQLWDTDPDSSYSSFRLYTDAEEHMVCREGSLIALCESFYEVEGSTILLDLVGSTATTWYLQDPYRGFPLASCPAEFDCDPTQSWAFAGVDNTLQPFPASFSMVIP